MNTPTRALVLPAVWDNTPAEPASTATTADQMSGRQMNRVNGRASVMSWIETTPNQRASTAKPQLIGDRHHEAADQQPERLTGQSTVLEGHAQCEGGDDRELRTHHHRADHQDR